MKFLMKLALVVLVLGGMLTAAGAAMGGEFYSAWYGGRPHTWREASGVGAELFGHTVSLSDFVRHAMRDGFHEAWDDVRGSWDEAWNDVQDDLDDAAHDMQEAVHDVRDAASDIADDIAETGDIRKLDFELKHGSYTIVTGDSLRIDDSNGSHLRTFLDADGTYHIQALADSGQNQDVTITLPADLALNEVEIDVGAGEVTLCDLSAREIELTVGAGTLEASLLTADKVDLSVGMGSLTATLAGSFADYRYELEAGMGEIAVNGEQLASGIADEVRGGSGARELDISVGMGSVELETEA